MSWTFLIYGVLPVLVFVVVDAVAPLKWAVVAAVAAAILDVVLTFVVVGQWDPFGIGAVVLFAALGVWAVKRNDKTLVKLQPTVMAAVLALFLAYHQWLGPSLLDTYGSLLKAAAPPEVTKLLERPEGLALLRQSVLMIMIVLVAHGALCAFAAYRLSNGWWLAIRVVGFWALLAVAMVVQTVRLAFGTS